MRIYRNIAEAIVNGLSEIHCKEHLAGYVVPKLLKSNKKWGSRDRSQIAETIYTITRYWRFYQFITDADACNNNALWNVLAAYITLHDGELPSWEEFSDFSIDEAKVRTANSEFSINESIPDWLDQEGRKQLGDKMWEAEIKAMNQPAEVVLRVNPLAIPKKENQKKEFVQKELQKQNVGTELLINYNDALQLQQRKSILHTKAYQKGWVEIQDANSQLVAPFCLPAEGNLIIDTCAGGGGKSLHLAALTNNKADVFALDVLPHKISELEKRAKRAKAYCIEAGTVVEFPLKEFYKQADVVLIDAPCSGLGTLKRDPDKKWKLTPEFLTEITTVQQQILQDYAPLTATNGYLIYATCSILPSENAEQIKAFLDTAIGRQFILDEQKMLFSHQTGYDGFYMARLKRLKANSQ